MNKVYIGVGVFILVGVAYFFFGMTGNVVAGELIDDGSVVKFALDSASEDAQFFDYEGIEFFIVKAKDGSVKTAISDFRSSTCFFKSSEVADSGSASVAAASSRSAGINFRTIATTVSPSFSSDWFNLSSFCFSKSCPLSMRFWSDSFILEKATAPLSRSSFQPM